MDNYLFLPWQFKDSLFNLTLTFIYVGCFWFFTTINIILELLNCNLSLNFKLTLIFKKYITQQLAGGLPWWLSGEESAWQCMRCGFNPWAGRSCGGGHGNPLQYSCLENPMDRGAWPGTVHRVAKSWDTTEAMQRTLMQMTKSKNDISNFWRLLTLWRSLLPESIYCQHLDTLYHFVLILSVSNTIRMPSRILS